MVTNTTTWKPDTCDCVLSYDWDTNDPDDKRVHKNYRFLNRCAIHADDKKVNHDIILGENTTKNLAAEEIRSHIDVGRVEEAIEEWTLEGQVPNRTVKIKLKDQSKKNKALTDKLTNKFGSGKIEIV